MDRTATRRQAGLSQIRQKNAETFGGKMSAMSDHRALWRRAGSIFRARRNGALVNGLGTPGGSNSFFEFGPFRLFPTERRLERDGKPVPAVGRAFDLLAVLVDRAGEVVPSRTLLECVWPDVTVEETSLRFHIKNLRKVLGDRGPNNRFIRNVPGRGYCFAAPVKRLAEADGGISNSEPSIARSNLPGRTSAVVGRSNSVEALTREISERRLVTITGPGGIGKTTLAIVTAETLRSSFDGLFFVDLAPIENPSLVISAVTTALGAALSADDPFLGVVDFLRNKRVLVVLDNCEQVVEAVARLADRILLDTDRAHMLITSRETLQIAGERVHRLMPQCPPFKADITAPEAMSYPAVQLFVDRATASIGDFLLDDALAPAAAEICRRLDGIPLAIELAAARVEFFGVGALAKALNDMFAVLTQGRRLALPRHQRLRATLDWSYNLLSPMEQTVLRRIAIFRAPSTLESAAEVVAGPGVSTAGAVEAMSGLVAKSLLTVESPGGTAQYRLLETTRLYASEKLIASGEGPQTARGHAEHFLRLFTFEQADRLTDLGARGPLYARRIDDVRAALDWSFSQDGDMPIGLDLVAASVQLWFQLSLNFEYRGRLERALRALSESPAQDAMLELRLQIALGHTLWYMQSDLELMARAFARALELADRTDDAPDRLRLQALWGLWAAEPVSIGRRSRLRHDMRAWPGQWAIRLSFCSAKEPLP
jgi:predicted ATPase/DNA-binding winged helix-turn-helix (wHTH) protein